jgi:hypothetical protein
VAVAVAVLLVHQTQQRPLAGALVDIWKKQFLHLLQLIPTQLALVEQQVQVAVAVLSMVVLVVLV